MLILVPAPKATAVPDTTLPRANLIHELITSYVLVKCGTAGEESVRQSAAVN
jgi:hypothetical protein